MPDTPNNLDQAVVSERPLGSGFEALGSFLPFLSPLLSLGTAGIQRKWAIQDRDFQNFYNSPAQQVKRLKEAGLPLAAMFGGGFSGQSDQPRATNIDPDLGTAQALSLYMQNEIQKRQTKLIEAETRKMNAEAYASETYANWLRTEDVRNYGEGNIPVSNADMTYNLQMDQKKAAVTLTGVLTDLRNVEIAGKKIINEQNQINLDLLKELQNDGLLREEFYANFLNVVYKNNLLKQEYSRKEFEVNLRQRMDDFFLNAPPDSLASGIQAFLYGIARRWLVSY